MPEYKALLAADMDNTLLMPGEDVPAENRKAVAALKEHGIAFTIATGRSSYLVDKFASDLGIDVPVITGNGGALYDRHQRKDIFSSDFAPDKLRQVLGLMFERKVDTTLYSTKGIYFTPFSTRKFFCDIYNSTAPKDRLAPLFDLSEEDFRAGNYPSFNKFLLIKPPADIENMLRTDKELECVESADGLYDVMNAGVSKGTALLKLGETLGLDRSKIFAIGDSENDLSMIEAAGGGIAMGNSSPSVLEAASYITGICEENGFAKAVYEYIIPTVENL